ncbi:MAG: glycosyltransferase [Pseudoxanthomonas sp.]
MSGGSERFLRNLVRLLPADRYRITIVQLTDAGMHDRGHYSLRSLEHVELLALHVDAVYGRRGWRAYKALRDLLKSERFDVIQSQHAKSDLLNALLPLPAGSVRISSRRDMGFNKSPRMRLASRFLNHRYACVVAPANPILDGLVESEGLSRDRMLCIPNGVDTELFSPPSAKERSRARQRLGIADETVAIGCLASLTPVKRHVDLLEAFAMVRAKAPDTQLLLIGEGPLREAIVAQAQGLGLGESIRLLGAVSDVRSAAAALDISVLSSSTEGMSNAILESMSCGLPVVATAVGGNPDLVEDGVNGLLAPAHAPEALAQCLLRLVESGELRLRFGQAGRHQIERAYSLDGMAASFDRLYRRLLAPRALPT